MSSNCNLTTITVSGTVGAMTALAPPSPPPSNGIVLSGTVLPFDPKTIELLLAVNAAITATLQCKKAMDEARDSGEQDLLNYARDFRVTCVDEEVALDNLREHIGGRL